MKEKIKFTKELDKEMNEMVGKKILRHTCQLFCENDNGLQPYGSGVFVIINKIHFLLTVSHVTEDWTDDNPLFVRIGQESYVSIVGTIKETDIEKSHKVDIAYVELDKRIIADLDGPYLFLPISKFRDHKKILDAMQYCVMGYPEKSQQLIDGKKESSAQAYFLKPSKSKVYKKYGFNPDYFHLLEIKGKGTDVKTGETRKLDSHFYGLSGCGLWLLLVDYDGKNYSCDYRLIGIMSEFRKGKYFCLIGVKIKIMLGALIKFAGVKVRTKDAPLF